MLAGRFSSVGATCSLAVIVLWERSLLTELPSLSKHTHYRQVIPTGFAIDCDSFIVNNIAHLHRLRLAGRLGRRLGRGWPIVVFTPSVVTPAVSGSVDDCVACPVRSTL